MVQSRLSRRTLKQSKKQIYVSVIAIVALIFITLNFGPLLIAATGNIIDLITGKSGQTTIVSDAKIQPPLLDPLPQATPSSDITITGRTFYEDAQIELYLNGLRYRTVNVVSFDFEIANVELSLGENIITARTVRNNERSDFSQEHKISYIKDDPKLEISFPQNGQNFSGGDREIIIMGTTDADNSVEVNGFIAIVDVNGNFSYTLRLDEGENKIKITATNLAGRSIENELTVSYSP